MGRRKVLGIDLGTTYSCVAYVNDYGKAEVIPNQSDERTTPSVVWFNDDRVIIGEDAKSMSSVNPNAVCSFIKRQMGSDDYTFDVNGVKYSPEHISSLILRKLVQDAWAALGEEIRDVVITCPAYFFIKEREATKRAGEEAGLNVLQIVNEPTAAAVSYGVQPQTGQNGVTLVYDLGGGTFDVTVMRSTTRGIDVICTDGDHQLGGKDWDDCLARYLADRFEEETDSEIDLAEDQEFYFDLMQRSEKVKKDLSQKTSANIRMSHPEEGTVRFEITRSEFEDLTGDLLEKTIILTRSCIETARSKGAYPIEKILLVGGSSRMPQVAAKIQQEFGITPELYDPDEAVAKGAAIIGNNLALQEMVKDHLPSKNRRLVLDDVPEAQKKEAMDEVIRETGCPPKVMEDAMRTVRNVASKTFGAVSTTEWNFQSVSNIIYKNTPLPCEKSVNFSTLVDGQTSTLTELMENLSDQPSDSDMEQYLHEYDTAMFLLMKELNKIIKNQNAIENVLAQVNSVILKLGTPIEESQKLGEIELEFACGPLPASSPIVITYRMDENGLLTATVTEMTHGSSVTKVFSTDAASHTKEFEEATQKCRRLIVE